MEITPPDIENFISHWIQSRSWIGVKCAHLCLHNNAFGIHPCNHTIISHRVLYVFTDDDMRAGLLADEWDELTRKILTLIKEHPEWKRILENDIMALKQPSNP